MYKYKRIVFFSFLLIFISFCVFSYKLGNMDEIWNFNFSNCISNGLVPYKDFSIIQMPFLPFVLGILLKLTAKELIVMRIAATILWFLIYILIFKIFKILKIKEAMCYLCIFIFSLIFKDYYCIDYNIFSVFLTLIVVICELKNDYDNKKNNFIIGILGGLTILTKQTIGLTVCAIIVLYKVLLLFKTRNKKDIILIILLRVIGIIIPLIFFLTYLLCTNSITYFFDYAVFGLKTFSNKISYINLVFNKYFFIRELSILIPVYWFIYLLYFIKKQNQKYLIILMYSIASFILAFPISDNIHFLFASIVSLIGMVWITNDIFIYVYKHCLYKLFGKLSRYYILGDLMFILLFVILLFYSRPNFTNLSKLKHFYYIPVDKELEKNIIVVDKYILKSEKKIYILNFNAAIYMIPIGRYNKDYDMFLNGNLGQLGEKGQIEKIKNEDALYLITNNKVKRNWQNPEKVRQYIIDNLKIVDKIDFFDVYDRM